MREDEISAFLQEDDHAQTVKYLLFWSDGLLLGASTDYVSEIITRVSITRLPLVPEYISGVINLRGQIVPIVDIRRLMGKAPGDTFCTVVLDIEGTLLGILVDEMSRMVDLPEGAVQSIPVHSAQKFISGMCTLPGGGEVMMVLDCPALLSHE